MLLRPGNMVHAALNARLLKASAPRPTAAQTICHSDVILTTIALDEPPSYYLSEFLSGDNLPYILVSALLVVLAFIISASEAAMFSLKPEQVDEIRKKQTRQGKSISEML